jgi:serine-type D-Ala-D-Ala carboxypeptidase (penicillin-binding protein 5/6)
MIVFLALFSSATGFAQTIPTSAPYAILVDYESGMVLFEKSADSLMEPASTAKIMTAELVFHELAAGRLKLDDTFPVSENAWRKGGGVAGGSSMFAVVNSRIAIEDLLRGLIIESGNDAAIALAEGVAGTEDAFATLMTRRANDLEMTKSTFANPWGKSDPEQRVTARDMAHLAAHIIRTYPQYYHYFGEKDFTWNKIHQMNRNPLLTMELGADGLKTGDIKESGFGLVGSAVQNGQRLILVLNGLKSANERAEEARRILNWGFRSFDRKTLFSETDIIGTAKVFGGSVNEVGLVSNKPITLLLPRTSGDKLIGKLTYMGPLIAPVEQGNEVAKLRLYRGNALVQETPLFTASSVNVGSLTQRSIDAGLELGLTLFRQMVQKSK